MREKRLCGHPLVEPFKLQSYDDGTNRNRARNGCAERNVRRQWQLEQIAALVFRQVTPLSFRPRPRLWHFAHVKPSPAVWPRWSPLSLRLSLPLSFRGSEASREICSSQPGPRAIHLARAVVDYQWVSEYFVWGGGKIDTTLHRVKSVLIHIQSVRKTRCARWFARAISLPGGAT